LPGFVLTQSAEADIREVYEFTRLRWDEGQADAYLMGLFATFELLGKHPKSGRMRGDLSEGVRSFAHRIHVVFYLEHDRSVAILRVLHGARDLPNALGPEG
jgi:toxin ParE1/3/4